MSAADNAPEIAEMLETVMKKLKKGTYTVKVKDTAEGTANYKAGTRTVTVKIKVK